MRLEFGDRLVPKYLLVPSSRQTRSDDAVEYVLLPVNYSGLEKPEDPPKLPMRIKEYLSEADDGTIRFSPGMIVKLSRVRTLPVIPRGAEFVNHDLPELPLFPEL